MPSITRVGCNKLMNEVGYVLFEELGSISHEEASVLSCLLYTSDAADD